MAIKLKILYSILLLLALIIIKKIVGWTSPDVNNSNVECLKECLYENSKLQKVIITSIKQKFEIDFVENSDKHCFNPFFPLIHIKIDTSPIAWIQIVRTDSSEEHLKLFVDTTPQFAPFYNFNDTFYDAPLWIYSLFNKPLTFWKSHTYAVKVNHTTKTITCIGGIKWGFELKFYRLRPKMILPSSLSHEDWNKDLVILKSYLPTYTIDK